MASRGQLASSGGLGISGSKPPTASASARPSRSGRTGSVSVILLPLSEVFASYVTLDCAKMNILRYWPAHG